MDYLSVLPPVNATTLRDHLYEQVKPPQVIDYVIDVGYDHAEQPAIFITAVLAASLPGYHMVMTADNIRHEARSFVPSAEYTVYVDFSTGRPANERRL